MTRTPLVLAALITLATLAAPQPAAAQPGGPGTPPVRPRRGLEGGVGLWLGDIDCRSEGSGGCDDFTEAAGLNLHGTFMFTTKLGVGLDLWPMVHTEEDLTFTHVVSTVVLKWRPVVGLTLGAGLGHAQARVKFRSVELASKNAPAILLSAGYDVAHGRSWAIDLQFRIGAGFYGDDDGDGNADVVGRNIGIGAQMSWM